LLLIVIIFLFLAAVTLIVYSVLPHLFQKAEDWQLTKEKEVAIQMEKLYFDRHPRSIVQLYFILPIILGVTGYFVSKTAIFSIIGIALGLAIPNFILKIRFAKRKQKFTSQLLDGINLMSSSLKGGLSLLQAIEVVAEEMPPPISQEFGYVIRENKIGVSFEDSLAHLKERMPAEELALIVSSILVARETGGDLTKVFSRLSVTIRDNNKLKQNIKTLTLQGRLQAIIMSALPFFFVGAIVTMNKHHFDIMLQSDLGRFLLILAGILQVLGMFLIRKFSIIKI
jgi:tight adherence protein B